MRHLARIARIVVFLLSAAVARAEPPAATGPTDAEQVRRSVVAQLVRAFDGWLEQPERYRATALKESRAFPEGTLYPFVVPAYGYVNLAIAEPAEADGHLEKAALLIELARPIVAERLQAPGGDLTRVTGYGEQGTYLAYFTLALSGYRVAGGDDRFDALRAHLCRVLADAVIQREGRAFKSYPHSVWSLDTTAAAVSLTIEDRLSGRAEYGPVVRKHLDWLRASGSDAALGLPVAQHDPDARRAIDAPRGCDLSWRIALLSQVDGEYAGEIYDRYLDAFWIERPPLTGFAEWPHGREGWAGVDSGPIFNGIGSTASAFGVATARAMVDEAREQTLLRQFGLAQTLRHLAVETERRTGKQTLRGYARFDPAYVSGIFYGDCVLFYSFTFERWDAARADAGGAASGR